MVARQRASLQQTQSKSVELMLAEDVESLGRQGDIVRVKPGFARNYLLPQGLATVATAENKRNVERHRAKLAEIQAKKLKDLEKVAAQVAKYSVTLEANANAEGHLYGSIVDRDISKALKAAGFAIEPDQVRLDGPLKELGMYTVKIQLHGDIKTEVKVWVVPAAKVGA